MQIGKIQDKVQEGIRASFVFCSALLREKEDAFS